MTIQELRDKGWIIFEAISGSQAYGTALPTSDTDIRGIFVMPTEEILKANPTTDGSYPYIPQVNDATNDVTFFEIGRFIELLEKGNPNILELLNVPDDCIVYKDPKFDEYFDDKNQFITKQLQYTFAGYAKTQIGKAKGMNKKIHNPQPKQRKDILEFCYIMQGSKSIPFWKWYHKLFHINNEVDKEFAVKEVVGNWGLVKVPNGDNYFAFYIDDGSMNYRGLIKDLTTTELRLSSVPKMDAEVDKPINLWFNLDGFKKHCKDHKEYWEWVEKRNPQRYLDNMKGEIGYDHKNMMHCVRLIEMARDISYGNGIIVRRPNREELLNIRNGGCTYEDIMTYVETELEKVETSFKHAKMPEKVDRNYTRALLQKIRMDNLTPMYVAGIDPVTTDGESFGAMMKIYGKNKLYD